MPDDRDRPDQPHAAEPAGLARQPLAPDEAHAMARALTAGRAAVAAVFDGYAGRGRNRRTADFKTLALGVTDLTEAAAKAFLAADRAGFFGPLLADLGARGLIDLRHATRVLSEARGAPDRAARLLVPQRAGGRSVTLEDFTPDMASWIGMETFVRGLMTAMRRTCMVVVGAPGSLAPITGTGFLVGPQTVLTNWHVLQHEIDPATGTAKDGSNARIACHFERVNDLQPAEVAFAVADWLVDFSPMDLAGVDPGKGYADMSALRPHALDYCAIRLSGAPGRLRGWYDLAQPGRLDDDRNLTFVIQHPAAGRMVAAATAGATLELPDRKFLLHRARTAQGSSGGLVLDHELNVIGLHHSATYEKATNTLIANRASCATAINAANPALGAALPEYDRIWRVLASDGPRAVIGRGRSVDILRRMATNPDQPILFVRGAGGSGKSFTADLLRATLLPEDHLVVSLTAAELPATPHALATSILNRAGAPASAIAALPQDGATHGTSAAWIRDALVPALASALTDLLATSATDGRSRILWLVLDNLDASDIPRTDARLLLDALYEAAPGLRILRILLIGLPGLASVNPAATITEPLPSPSDLREDDLANALGAILTECKVTALKEDLHLHARLALATADLLDVPDHPTSRLARVSDVLARVYLATAEEWKNR